MNIDEIAFLKLGVLIGETEPSRAVFWADSKLSSENNEYQFETLCELSISKKDSRSVLSKLNEFDNHDIDMNIINLYLEYYRYKYSNGSLTEQEIQQKIVRLFTIHEVLSFYNQEVLVYASMFNENLNLSKSGFGEYLDTSKEINNFFELSLGNKSVVNIEDVVKMFK